MSLKQGPRSYKQLNEGWNADPNAPEPVLTIDHNTVHLDFGLNYMVYPQYKEEDTGRLTFRNVHKVAFNAMNDEGYIRGQYRYTDDSLPWGEFYEIETKWTNDFPDWNVMVPGSGGEEKELTHYIFFMRDNTFECVAKSFEFTVL